MGLAFEGASGSVITCKRDDMSANLKITNLWKKVTEGIMVVGRSAPMNSGSVVHFTRAKLSGVVNLFVFIFDLCCVLLSYEQDNNTTKAREGESALSSQL